MQSSVGGAGAAVSGVVKWFNSTKGFGFIRPDDGDRDVFLHISALRRSGFEDAPEGAKVLIEIEQGQKGPQVARLLEMDGQAGQPEAVRPPRRSFGDSDSAGPRDSFGGRGPRGGDGRGERRSGPGRSWRG
jgi:CspA family cold shock protein